MNDTHLMNRLRFKQIRLFAKIVERLTPGTRPSRLLGALGSNPLIDQSLAGFRRVFPTFEEAHHQAAKYRVLSHEHSGNINIHSTRTDQIRPSDYPVLFHMQKMMDEVTSVLDIGGSIGNLFYSYSRVLEFPLEVTWTVLELPKTIAAGRQIADQRDERRLRFIERVEDCRPVDLVIISGALHYFEQLPPELTHGLRRQPRHIIINRTPVIDGPSAITIQDHEYYFALSPARVLSRETLMRAMNEAGYELVDEWKAPELRLLIPLHPEASVSAYSGFYFRMKQPAKRPAPPPDSASVKEYLPVLIPAGTPAEAPYHPTQVGRP